MFDQSLNAAVGDGLRSSISNLEGVVRELDKAIFGDMPTTEAAKTPEPANKFMAMKDRLDRVTVRLAQLTEAVRNA